MRSKMVSTFILFILLTCFFACATTPKTVINVNFLKQKEVEVSEGEIILLSLKSNATTGFKWELARITDESVIEFLDNKYKAPKPKKPGRRGPATGVPGKELWTFKALKKGKSIVFMEYSRPWEGGEKAVKKFVLTVSVK